MESFYTAYKTDIGIKKKTNQDSLLLQGISNGKSEILLAVLCDGMGGMSKGELASALLVREFSEWFLKSFSQQYEFADLEGIRKQWGALLKECNGKLMSYGEERGIQLGTTVTAIIFLPHNDYLICHVGDTRAYRISDALEQMTEDHTWLAREVKRGNITEKDAASDSRKNILLQCIGVNKRFEPQYLTGKLLSGEAVLLCSDGFRHMVSESEIYKMLRPKQLHEEREMEQRLAELIDLNKTRQETDNITAIYIKKK